MRLIYLGTPRFAVPTLEAILRAGHQVLEVITQPDRPQGRTQTLVPSPVKHCALAHGLPVYQPERIRRLEPAAHLRALAPELMVVVGYGQIIPQTIIDIPPRGIINVHASLLPRLRGAAPIQWAIVRGDEVTGVTTMRIDAGLDTGDILLQASTEIGPDEDTVALGERLAHMGAKLLVQTLASDPPRRPQDPALATLAPLLSKEDGRIDWSGSARAIHNLVRGLQPWPGAHSTFEGGLFHIWISRVSSPEAPPAMRPGDLHLDREGLHAACGYGEWLKLIEVQPEGRRRMAGDEFARGRRIAAGAKLGS